MVPQNILKVTETLMLKRLIFQTYSSKNIHEIRSSCSQDNYVFLPIVWRLTGIHEYLTGKIR